MPDSTITKCALAQSLKQQMADRPLEKISVGEVCERCDMNRKSFYYHFKDKYDLVNWIFSFEFLSGVESSNYGNAWDFLLDICTYFYENRIFYIRAFEVEGQNSFSAYFAETIGPITREHFRAVFEGNENTEFYAEFFTDAFRLAIIRWLRERPELSPQEIVSLLQNAVAGVAKKYMDVLEQEQAAGQTEH